MTREEKIIEIKLLQKQIKQHFRQLDRLKKLKETKRINVLADRIFKMFNHLAQARMLYNEIMAIASQPIPKHKGVFPESGVAFADNVNKPELVTSNRGVQSYIITDKK